MDMRTAWTKDVLHVHQDGALLTFLDTFPKLLIYLTFLGEYRCNKVQETVITTIPF